MKKPHFNSSQRQAILCDTFEGASLMLNLEVKKALRAVRKESGWVAMKATERLIVRGLNITLLGRDVKKKWYELF